MAGRREYRHGDGWARDLEQTLLEAQPISPGIRLGDAPVLRLQLKNLAGDPVFIKRNVSHVGKIGA